MFSNKLIFNGLNPSLVDLKSFSVSSDTGVRVTSANWASPADGLRLEFVIDRCGDQWWQPVMMCGAPLRLSASMPRITVDYPGVYRLVPDPSAPTTIAVIDAFLRSATLHPDIFPDVTCAPSGPAPATLSSGSFDATGSAISAGDLPGIAAGGVLRGFTINNFGPGDVIFTGADGVDTKFPQGSYTWSVEDDPDSMSGWKLDPASARVVVQYLYL